MSPRGSGTVQKKSTRSVAGKKFYLIWWAPIKDDNGCQVQPSSLTVVKREKLSVKHRVVGVETKLPWKFQGTTKFYDAKILAEGDNEEALENIEACAVTGTIIPATEKAYTAAVLSAKKSQERLKRLFNKENRSKQADESTSLLQSTSILEERPTAPLRQRQAAKNLGNDSSDHLSNRASTSLVTPATGMDLMMVQLRDDIVKAFSPVTAPKMFMLERLEHTVAKYAESSHSPCRWMFDVINMARKKLCLALGSAIDNELLPPTDLQLPDDYFEPTTNKSPLADGYDLFVPAHIRLEVNWRLQSATKWEQAVCTFLTCIYEKNLKWLSALGTKGTVGISARLHKFLLKYIQDKYDSNLTDNQLNNHINRLCGNRIRTVKRKLKEELDAMQSSSGADVESDSSQTSHSNGTNASVTGTYSVPTTPVHSNVGNFNSSSQSTPHTPYGTNTSAAESSPSVTTTPGHSNVGDFISPRTSTQGTPYDWSRHSASPAPLFPAPQPSASELQRSALSSDSQCYTNLDSMPPGIPPSQPWFGSAPASTLHSASVGEADCGSERSQHHSSNSYHTGFPYAGLHMAAMM